MFLFLLQSNWILEEKLSMPLVGEGDFFGSLTTIDAFLAAIIPVL